MRRHEHCSCDLCFSAQCEQPGHAQELIVSFVQEMKEIYWNWEKCRFHTLQVAQ
jgi:hypothetical protein